MPTSQNLAEMPVLEEVSKTTVETAPPSPPDIIQLPDGRQLIKQKLSGEDYFDFMRSSLQSKDPIEGMQALNLKMFRWADGSPLTIAQLLEPEESGGIGFSGCSLLSEHTSKLFPTGQTEKRSLLPAE